MVLHDGWSSNSTVEDQEEEETPLLQKQAEQYTVSPHCCSVRYNLAFMMFLGFAVVYGLRVNLSVAMVAMVNTTQPSFNESESNECPGSSTSNSSENPNKSDGAPKYPWTPQTQGVLLGAFFFGYLFTQVPGGYLSGRCGGSKFLGGGVLGTAVLTILTPLAAELGVNWLFALRVLEGLGEGVTFPAMMAMWACWAPPLERSRLITISGAGGNFGAFIAFPLTGFICHSLGWPAVFYICGGAGCLWAVLWFIMVSDEPRTHSRISDRERKYIINSIGSENKSSQTIGAIHHLATIVYFHRAMPYIDDSSLIITVPLKTDGNVGWFTSWHQDSKNPEWNRFKNPFHVGRKVGGSHGWSVPLRPMMFSSPFWAISITQMCANWSYYTLLTSLPTYMDTVLHFDLRQNSFLSALPYLGGWLFSVLSGVCADYLLEREVLSITAVRKIFTFVGLLIPAGLLVAVGYSGCSGILAVTLLTLSTTLGGISAAGVFVNLIDIAPQYVGVLHGITNTLGTIPGVLAPIAVGQLAKHHTLMGWRKVFYLSAGLSVFGAFYYTWFGSGKIQTWARRDNQTETETERKH